MLANRQRGRGLHIAQQGVENIAQRDHEVQHVGVQRPVELGRHHQRTAVPGRNEAREVHEGQVRQRPLDLVLRQHDVPQQQRKPVRLGFQLQHQVETAADLAVLAGRRRPSPIRVATHPHLLETSQRQRSC